MRSSSKISRSDDDDDDDDAVLDRVLDGPRITAALKRDPLRRRGRRGRNLVRSSSMPVKKHAAKAPVAPAAAVAGKAVGVGMQPVRPVGRRKSRGAVPRIRRSRTSVSVREHLKQNKKKQRPQLPPARPRPQQASQRRPPKRRSLVVHQEDRRTEAEQQVTEAERKKQENAGAAAVVSSLDSFDDFTADFLRQAATRIAAASADSDGDLEDNDDGDEAATAELPSFDRTVRDDPPRSTSLEFDDFTTSFLRDTVSKLKLKGDPVPIDWSVSTASDTSDTASKLKVKGDPVPLDWSVSTASDVSDDLSRWRDRNSFGDDDDDDVHVDEDENKQRAAQLQHSSSSHSSVLFDEFTRDFLLDSVAQYRQSSAAIVSDRVDARIDGLLSSMPNSQQSSHSWSSSKTNDNSHNIMFLDEYRERYEAMFARSDEAPEHYGGQLFQRLPEELLVNIFSFLDVRTMLTGAIRVARSWKRIIDDRRGMGGCWNKHVRIPASIANVLGDDELMRAAPKWTGVRHFDLAHCTCLSVVGLSVLARQCTELTSLSLAYCDQIDDHAMRALSQSLVAGTLTSLDLTMCHRITDDGIEAVAKAQPGLARIVLRRCSSLTDKAVHLLAQYCGKSLREVSLEWCRGITDLSLHRLARSCVSLERLNVRWCRDVTDTGLRNVVRCCKQLQYLCLDHCASVSDNTLQLIGAHCRNLRHLSLVYCKLITDTGVDTLLAGTKSRLRELNLDYCRGVSRAMLTRLLSSRRVRVTAAKCEHSTRMQAKHYSIEAECNAIQ